MINAKLVVVGGAKQTEVNLKKLPVTIGRSNDASITLPHSLVSRQHCEIFEEQGILYVRDLNSLNGTFLNNEKITGSRPLLPDQLLTLGNVTFRAAYAVSDIDLAAIQDQLETGSWTDDNDIGETIETDVLSMQLARSEEDSSYGEAAASQVVVIDDELPAASPSISLGAINQLPQEEKPANVDAVKIESEDEPDHSKTVQFKPGDIQINTGEEQQQEVPEDGSLQSFIRKLPK